MDKLSKEDTEEVKKAYIVAKNDSMVSYINGKSTEAKAEHIIDAFTIVSGAQTLGLNKARSIITQYAIFAKKKDAGMAIIVDPRKGTVKMGPPPT